MARLRVSIAEVMAIVPILSVGPGLYHSNPRFGFSAVIPSAGALAVGILATMLAGRRLRPSALLVAMAGSMLLPFVGAMLLSKANWGYYLNRPPVARRIAKARRIDSVTFVTTQTDDRGDSTFLPDPSRTIDEAIRHGRHDSYYCLSARALIALQDRGALPLDPRPMDPDRLSWLYDIVDRTGHLEAGGTYDDDYGRTHPYTEAKHLKGVVIEALGADGAPIVFIGVSGGEVSNDHYPYYEFLFSGVSTRGGPELLSWQRFYYDVAGLEGMEWPAIFVIFSIIEFAIALPSMMLIRLTFWICAVTSRRPTP